MRVYLAAPYQMKDVISDRAAELRAMGITVTSSWLVEPWGPKTQMHELTHEEHQRYAINDVQDIADSDVLVYQPDVTKTIIRAGRHVEFGIAIGIGLTRDLPILVVGEDRENIFHHYPQVTHYRTWEETKAALPSLALRVCNR